MKTILILSLAVLLCGCKPAAPQKWEYKIVYCMDEGFFKRVAATTPKDFEKAEAVAGEFDLEKRQHSFYADGVNGWELSGLFVEQKKDGRLVLIFKRPYQPAAK